MDEKELQALYNAMSQKFDVGDWNTFRSKMTNTQQRKNFYDAVGKQGFDLGEYNAYEQRLSGVKKKEAPSWAFFGGEKKSFPSSFKNSNQSDSEAQSTSVEQPKSRFRERWRKEEREKIDNIAQQQSPITSQLASTDAKISGDSDQPTKAAKTAAGIYNTLVGSVARIAGGLREVPQYKIPMDIFLPEVKRKDITDFIEQVRSPVSTKEDERKAASFDVTDGVTIDDVKGLLFSAPSTLLDMTAGSLTGGGTFVLQAINDASEELENNPNAKNLSDAERVGYIYINGLIQGALERVGVNKIIKSTGGSKFLQKKIANEITEELIAKGEKATAEQIEKEVIKKVSTLANQIKTKGVGVVKSIGWEGGTEGLQQGLSDVSRLATNRISGKEIFDEEDITANFLKNIINATSQGGAMGGLFSGAYSTMSSNAEAIKSQIGNAESQAEIEKIKNKVNEEISKGNLTKGEVIALQDERKLKENILAADPIGEANLNHATRVRENIQELGLSDAAQNEYVAQSLIEKSALAKSEKLTDPTLIKKQKEVAKEAAEIKEQLLQGIPPDKIITEAQQKKIEEEENNKREVERLEKSRELDNKEFDAKRKELDGRSPEDRIKIERLEKQKAEKNEDYDLKIEKLKPNVQEKVQDISSKTKTPEEIIVDEVNKGAILGGAEMAIKADPSQATEALRFIAQQAHGITETGKPASGGKAQIQNKEVLKAALEKFPTPKSTLTPPSPTDKVGEQRDGGNSVGGDVKLNYNDKGEHLAPNGKPSKLSESYAKEVRKKEFKDWFGDWENDPENASKVLDENGEPLMVYHGSNNEFSDFDKTQTKKGFFFSPKKHIAEIYGKNVNAYFVSIKKPLKKGANIQGAFDKTDIENTNHDGLIVYVAGSQEIIATEPTQIRPAGTKTQKEQSNDISEQSSKVEPDKPATNNKAAEQSLKEQPKASAPTDKVGEQQPTLTEDVIKEQGNQPSSNVVGGEDIKPIRQLGTGANVYYETNKYRVNDNLKNGKILLNVGDANGEVPLANIEFNNLKEAVFVAEKLNENAPNGLVSDYHNVEKIIENLRNEYNQKEVNLPSSETKTTNTPIQAQGAFSEESRKAIANNKQLPQQKEKKLTERLNEVDIDGIRDPYDKVLHYFANKGKIHPSAIQQIFGTKGRTEKTTEGEKRSRIGILGKNAPTIDQLAHSIWEEMGMPEDVTTMEIRDAVESVITSHNSWSSAAKELTSKYDYDALYERYMETKDGQDVIEIAEKLTDEEINHILELDSQKNKEQELEDYIESLQNKPEKAVKPTQPIESKEGGEPPTGRTTEAGVEVEGGKPKALANRLVDAKGTPEAAKEGIRKQGLDYEPKDQEQAEALAKSIIDELGIDEAVGEAQKQTFGGDVNTLIQTEALNRLYTEELTAKTSEDKFNIAEKFADIAIKLDEWARDKAGRGIAALNYFYKKSPLGMVIKQNKENKKDFDKWAKPKEKSWDEFLEEIQKEPEFKEFVDKKVQDELKKERAEARKERIKKVDDTIDKWIDDISKGHMGFVTIVPPPVIIGALKAAKAAYRAGENLTKIIQDAVDAITKAVGDSDWNIDGFKKKVESILGKSEPKNALEKYKDRLRQQIEDLDKQISYKKRKTTKKNKTELDEEAKKLVEQRDAKKKQLEEIAPLSETEEYQLRQLEKFRKKLKGLSEEQKDEVIRKSFKELIKNGALKQEDFRKIIANATGRGDLTPEQSVKMKELVRQANAVEDFAKRLRERKTPQSLENYKKAQIRAAKAARELSDMFDKKADYLKVIAASVQGNTLSLTNVAVLNPLFNIVNQLSTRLPIGALQSLYGAAVGSKSLNTVWSASTQKQFFKEVLKGLKEANVQLVTGMNRMDYDAKEVFTDQIRPFKSARELWHQVRSSKFGNAVARMMGKPEVERKERLTARQKVHRALQIAPGTTAEIIFRLLNYGDKPMRFGAGGATAAAFANSLGIKSGTLDWNIFLEFPREEAYRIYKSKGLSDKEAGEKADYIKESIIQEGKRSTFQQDNLFTDAINRVFGGGKKAETGLASLAKASLISPYIKIPSNAFWSYFNVAHPLIAVAQSTGHLINSKRLRSNGENVKADLQIREARYWAGHAAIGVALNMVIIPLVKAGVISASSDEDDPKKEREGERTYQQQGTIKIGNTVVPLRYFGSLGMLANSIAKDYEEMTPEQRENRDLLLMNLLEFWDTDDLKELQNGIFSNSAGLLGALGEGGTSANRFLINQINMYANLVQPAAVAQFSRAEMPYYNTRKADTFLKELDNSLLERSSLYRNLSGKYPPTKYNVWGDEMKKDDNFWFRMLGISRTRKDTFAQPIWEDYKKSKNTNFFPPAVSNSITVDGVKKKMSAEQVGQFERLVGSQRKELVTPFINGGIAITDENGNEVSYSGITDEKLKTKYLQLLYKQGYKQGKILFQLANPEFMPKNPEDAGEEEPEDQ